VSYRQIVESYVSAVECGSIAVGMPVAKAIERYGRDMDRQRDADFPFYFDIAAAEHACMFFPVALRHSSGRWDGQPFHLEGWQAFLIWNLFGWKRLDGTRRFRRAHVSVARKNGKSTIIAGITLLLSLEGEHDTQGFIGATKLEQAQIVFRMIEQMIGKSSDLSKVTKRTRNNIAIPMFDGYLRPIGSDKPFDGLNPHIVVFDELHAWKEHHREFYDTMTTGSAARTQPLQLTITTAGSDKSQLWNEETDYCKMVLNQDAEDESLFVYIAEMDEDDDPFDEANWIKSNPNLGVSVSIDYLREQANKAQSRPQERSKFLRYHGNRKVSSSETPLTSEIWDGLQVDQLTDWKTADCICCGIDLGGRNDLASYALVARFPAGSVEDEDGNESPVWRYECRVRSFIAEDTKRDLSQQPWANWIYEGKLTKARYVIPTLRDSLLADADEYGFSKVAFDPYNASQLGDELEQLGLTPAKMPQNYYHFNEPLREFLETVTEKRISHDGSDPVLRWAVGNFVLVRNSQDLIMPDKKTSNDKIDPLVSLVMALRMAMFEPAGSSGSLFLT
jgi:phage terminase large subunit-like protein